MQHQHRQTGQAQATRPTQGNQQQGQQQYGVIGQRQQQQVEQGLQEAPLTTHAPTQQAGTMVEQHAQTPPFPACPLRGLATAGDRHVAAHRGLIGEMHAQPLFDQTQVVLQILHH